MLNDFEQIALLHQNLTTFGIGKLKSEAEKAHNVIGGENSIIAPYAAMLGKRFEHRRGKPALAQRIEGDAQNGIGIAKADGVENVQLIGIAHNVAETPRSIRQIVGKAIVAMRSYRGTDQLIFLGSLDKISHAHLARGEPSKKSYAGIST